MKTKFISLLFAIVAGTSIIFAQSDPTNCVEAAAAALSVSQNHELYNGGKEYTIKGYVTKITNDDIEMFGNITFWMADESCGGEVLQAYRCVPESPDNPPIVGDLVEVTGNLTKFNQVPEFMQACKCVIIDQIQISGLYYHYCFKTAELTSQNRRFPFWSTAISIVDIPASINYNDATYSVTGIGVNSFYGCSSLTSVTIPNSVKGISDNAFYGCSSLSTLSIPNSVTIIGAHAFDGCSSLTSVEIPNSVTSIGQDAFSGCSNLTFVTIPNSVTSIGAHAFDGCSSLTSITCETLTPPTLGSTVFYSVDKSIPLYVPAESIDAYKAADQWKDFNVQAIPGSSCMQAKDFDFINGNIQEANSTVWYEYDIEKLLMTDKDVQFTFTNLGNNSCLVQIDAFPTCEDTNPFDQTTFTLSAGWTRRIIFPHAAFEIDADSILYFHIYSEQKLQFNAQLVDPEPFDPIICGNYNIIASNSEIPQEAGSSWYLIDMKDIRTKTMGDGVLKIKNLGTGDATIVTESAYHCPVTTRPLSITINLAPGEEYTRTINRSFAMQHDSVILHITTDMPISISLDFDKCHFAGTCGANGDNLTWELSCNGVLTISGTGEMENYGYQGASDFIFAPWNEYRESILSVIIEEGVTSIGRCAFKDCTSLTSVTIPSSITYIGELAFIVGEAFSDLYIFDLAAWCNINFDGQPHEGCNPLFFAKNFYISGTKVVGVVIPESITSISNCAFFAGFVSEDSAIHSITFESATPPT